ncbi:MAG: hypothetical protein QNJ38_05230 [Prochloraceae cyanobacterium]|nr:hypothetical protein [Prochloraceae cyanobacterium]
MNETILRKTKPSIFVFATLLAVTAAKSTLAQNVNISDAIAQEGNPLTFDLTLSTPSTGNIVLNLNTTDINAAGNIDYQNNNFQFSIDGGTNFQPGGGTNGTEITIPSGVTNIQVQIDSIADSNLELDETFTLRVANLVSGTVDNITDTGTGTIADFNSTSVSCPTPSVLIIGNPSRRSLYDLTNATIDPGTPITGLDPGVTLNATGFNIIDRYFYGLEDVNGDRSLYRFDSFGNALKLGEIASLNFGRYNSGDIDLDGYYYASNSGRTLIEVLDLNPNRSTYLTKIATITSPITLSSDLAVSPIDNRIYFIRNNRDLWSLEIDLATQSVISSINFGQTNFPGTTSVATGAAFFDVDGNFYAYNNRTGDLLRFPTQPTVSTTGQFIGQGSIVNNNDGTRCSIAPVVPTLTAPELILVKRIAAINGNILTNGGQDLSIFNNDFNDLNDNNPNWPTPLNTFLRGGINGGLVRPGDEVEYIIYFLSSGVGAVRNVKICSVLPTNTNFVADAFGINSGIALANSNSILPIAPTDLLTNNINDDRGNFYPPFSQTPDVCKDPNNLTNPLTAANNTNGAVVVNVVSDPVILDNAIAPGNPANSYGFIRFKVRIE